MGERGGSAGMPAGGWGAVTVDVPVAVVVAGSTAGATVGAGTSLVGAGTAAGVLAGAAESAGAVVVSSASETAPSDDGR